MYPKEATDPAANPTQITINAQGNAVPPSATVGASGATFNAAQACTLTFSPSCPFQGATNNVLSLSQGNNTENLISGVAQQTYTYYVTMSQEHGGPPQTEQFDIVVTS